MKDSNLTASRTDCSANGRSRRESDSGEPPNVFGRRGGACAEGPVGKEDRTNSIGAVFGLSSDA